MMKISEPVNDQSSNERLEPQSFCEIQLNSQVAFAESEVSVTITVTVFWKFCGMKEVDILVCVQRGPAAPPGQ